MSEASNRPTPVKRRMAEAMSVLQALGFPRQQPNDRSALTLLALLELKPGDPWRKAGNPLMGITPMMEFFARHYGREYKPNTRETVRRQTVHQFVQAALAIPNPDDPERPTNSPKAVYQIEPHALELLREFGGRKWSKKLQEYKKTVGALQGKYASEREVNRIPVRLADGGVLSLSPGGQNPLVRKILEEFCPVFTPGGVVLYVGDTQRKWTCFDKAGLRKLGFEIEAHGKMPDVVIYHGARQWLVLIEAVTSHGPVNPKRRLELKALFGRSSAGLVFVTAFMDRHSMLKHLGEIAWETEVWVAESPTHLIHFNGERFLGPYE